MKMRTVLAGFGCGLLLGLLGSAAAADPLSVPENLLVMPAIGAHELRVLSPTILELSLVSTQPSAASSGSVWNFIGPDGRAQLPAPQDFAVLAGAVPRAVQAVGFKRRVLYAPLKERDLRIGNQLYLQLAAPLPESETVEVKNPNARLWSGRMRFIATVDPLRFNPAIHVNQTGYLPAMPKKAMVGYYLGSFGEMAIPPATEFKLVAAADGREVHRGRLVPRPDRGFPFPCYEQVWEADFTGFTTPGEYRLLVPGLGTSFPFFIDDGVAAAFARTYALGLYHQRCGAANALPFTRFVHDACHTAPAEVPTMQFSNTQKFLAQETATYAKNPRHTAPPLKDFAAGLYPFQRQGRVDVAGGHHDAGDYSKYTLNSALFIHHLVFAADVFPGVAELDNLGLPESGDGKSDVLQEAKWEADFLARMQDSDGGFYFLVYPRNRRYENNVLPDRGDPQIVWPKNTAATAAAVAALAQTASSPRFKQAFPEAAAAYLEKAQKGWAFLERAIARLGQDGAYQKITHYGDEFMHDDELAWAACELFLATGDPALHRQVHQRLNPADPATRKWGWWRVYESYGCAERSYAFAVKSGRLKLGQVDPKLLIRCEDEVARSGEDQLRWARESAYGTSFPMPTKRVRSAGWYFSTDRAFDLAVAHQLDHPEQNDPRAKLLEAMISNLNYEAGGNPVNICHLTGLGWKRPREIVHQYAQNDRRVLPPGGIPLGNLQSGFGWMDRYKQELGALTFPSDGAQTDPYPIYDRWGDSFNLQTEFVIVNQARSLAMAAFLMARTPLKNQPWRSATAEIEIQNSKSGLRGGTFTASLRVPGLDLKDARIVWEAAGQEPAFGSTFTFSTTNGSPVWVEAEAHWPDGRRVSAAGSTDSRTTARLSEKGGPVK